MKWIPCEERLPNDNREVLISLEWGIDIGTYERGEWRSEWINHYDDDNVLAWMPLPQPYTADRKTEPSNSEKPNNSTISKMEQVDKPQTCDNCKWGEWYRKGYDITMMDDECGGCCSWNSKWTPKDEPKTQIKTQNSNLTFEKRKCIDCNFLTYMFGKTWCNIKCENPHDKVCDRFKPKVEPQTNADQRIQDVESVEPMQTERSE